MQKYLRHIAILIVLISISGGIYILSEAEGDLPVCLAAGAMVGIGLLSLIAFWGDRKRK